jgi:hypothetical protein
MSEKVVVVRLTTGEELIGLQVLPGSFGLHLKKYIQIVFTPPQGPGKGPGLSFAPFIPYIAPKDETLQIRDNAVMFSAEPDPNLEDAYRKTVGLPPKILTEKDRKLILPT